MAETPSDGPEAAVGKIGNLDSSPSAPPTSKWYEDWNGEQRIRSHGKWLAIIGGVDVMFTAIIEVMLTCFGHHMPQVLLQVLLVVGFGCIVLGCLEYFGRYQRWMKRQLRDEVHSLRDEIRLLREESSKQEAALQALVDLLPEEKSQAWHLGYAAAFRDRRTGTDATPAATAERDADVLKLVPRPTDPD